LAAPLNGHAGVEFEVASDGELGVVDEGAEIAFVDVGLDVDAEAAVFGGDFVGAEDAREGGDLAERDETGGLGVGEGDGEGAEAVEVFAVGALEADLDGPTFAALDGGGDVFAADAEEARALKAATPTDPLELDPQDAA
jgi:hypothetical protein